MAKHYVKNILRVFDQVTHDELQHGKTWSTMHFQGAQTLLNVIN